MTSDLHAVLRRYWGYATFRPVQERIVRSLMHGRDVAVVMPTGGGKSLCYQLPALLSGRTAVVVSPLLALMRDQQLQLEQMGIPAATLNSDLSGPEQAQVMRQARQGAYRLLYLSPERLAREDTVSWLQQVPLAFFAIDEAHCISEWGHEFRPEYRQLRRLREVFPDHPIAAFTASATQRVRQDILQQLHLRAPDKYILSFHRPNLRYLVQVCDQATQERLLLAALREHAENGNAIVYSPTIRGVAATVNFLAQYGIAAVPYHGQMESEARRANQERWMNDEVRVLVGTIAFGLGINKPGVRTVVHLSLPKSIEQYYQEAGRAGRDGQPADCLLLWKRQDVGLLAHFIGQLSDEEEKQRAWQRYRAVRDFAESDRCRHLQVCRHFGERPQWEQCAMCDVCGPVPEWLTAAPPLRAETALRPRRAPTAPARPAVSYRPPSDVAPAASALYAERLRAWRLATAREQQCAAFIVLHDATLQEICRRRPRTLAALRDVPGIGERKLALYGQAILAVLEAAE